MNTHCKFASEEWVDGSGFSNDGFERLQIKMYYLLDNYRFVVVGIVLKSCQSRHLVALPCDIDKDI